MTGLLLIFSNSPILDKRKAPCPCVFAVNYLDKIHSGFFSVLADENVSEARFGWPECRVIWSEMVSEGAKDNLGASRLRQTTLQYAIYCSPICGILVGNLRHIASPENATRATIQLNLHVIRHLHKSFIFALFAPNRQLGRKYSILA